MESQGKSIIKKWWFWAGLVVVLAIIGKAMGGDTATPISDPDLNHPISYDLGTATTAQAYQAALMVFQGKQPYKEVKPVAMASIDQINDSTLGGKFFDYTLKTKFRHSNGSLKMIMSSSETDSASARVAMGGWATDIQKQLQNH